MSKETNYIRLQNFVPWRRTYIYVDTKDPYLADPIFVERKIPVRYFGKEFGRPDIPYVIVMVKFPKKYENEFFSAMDRLCDKMLLTGHRDYQKFVHSFHELAGM